MSLGCRTAREADKSVVARIRVVPSHRRNEHVLCHILDCRQVPEARECLTVHVWVEALEEGDPPLCLAALCGLYRLREAVRVCQSLTVSLGFIE
jgi:hypothetical protein